MENFSEKLKNAFKQVEKHEKIVFELQADKDGVKYDVYTQDAESETQLDALQAELDSLQDELADAEVALADLEQKNPKTATPRNMPNGKKAFRRQRQKLTIWKKKLTN